MGLFSKKYKIGKGHITFFEKNKANIYINAVPVWDEKGKKNIIMVEKNSLPFLIFMFYFDKVVFNMPENLSVETIKHLHALATKSFYKIGEYFEKSKEIPEKEEWKKIRKELKSPNNWVFSINANEGNGERIVDIDFFLSTKGFFFVQTHFPLSLKYIDAKSYLSIEAFFEFVLDVTPCETCFYEFLPAFLVQCKLYREKRPSLNKLGMAPDYALKTIHEMINEESS